MTKILLLSVVALVLYGYRVPEGYRKLSVLEARFPRRPLLGSWVDKEQVASGVYRNS
jgi:hypothetical protein